MPWHAMHPIQNLFLESFSYELQFDMHFYMHSYLHKKFILVKSGCYSKPRRWRWLGLRPEEGEEGAGLGWAEREKWAA
jgi:hypothetical protein